MSAAAAQQGPDPHELRPALDLDAAVAVLSAAVAAGSAQVLVDPAAGRTLIRTGSGVTALDPPGGALGTEPVALSETVELPTADGPLRAVAVGAAGETAAAVLVGRPEDTTGTLVHLHRGCVLGDALGHRRCPRRQALAAALAQMRRAGAGVVLYARDDAQLGCCLPTGPTERPVSEAVLAGFRAVLAPLALRGVQLLAGCERTELADALGLDVAPVVKR